VRKRRERCSGGGNRIKIGGDGWWRPSCGRRRRERCSGSMSEEEEGKAQRRRERGRGGKGAVVQQERRGGLRLTPLEP
jgi:hypothetical protein